MDLYYYKIVYLIFKLTIVTPISPSPKVPNLKESTCLLVFKNLWIPERKAPVPLPWTILTGDNFAIKQSSKYLSTIGIASSTVRPSKFISGLTDWDLKEDLTL